MRKHYARLSSKTILFAAKLPIFFMTINHTPGASFYYRLYIIALSLSTVIILSYLVCIDHGRHIIDVRTSREAKPTTILRTKYYYCITAVLLTLMGALVSVIALIRWFVHPLTPYPIHPPPLPLTLH